MNMTKCRRCAECEDFSHHWMDNSNFGNDPTNPDGEENYNTEATHVCKHCPACGNECELCQGGGCANCDGEGVLPDLQTIAREVLAQDQPLEDDWDLLEKAKKLAIAVTAKARTA